MRRSGFLFAAVFAMAPAQESTTRTVASSFVVVEKNAYFIAPAKLVVDAVVESVDFTPDGRFVFIAGRNRESVSAETALKRALAEGDRAEQPTWYKVWDSKTDQTRDVPRSLLTIFERLARDEGGIAFTAQPGVVLAWSERQAPANSEDSQIVVERASFVDGSSRTLARTDVTDGFVGFVTVSPTKPLFVTYRVKRNRPVDATGNKSQVEFTAYDFNGNVMKSGSSTVNGRAAVFQWTKDGENLVGRCWITAAIGAKPVVKQLVLNLKTGIASLTDEAIPTYMDEESEPEIGSVLADLETKLDGKSVPVRSLWVRSSKPSERPSAYIASDVQAQWMSPDLKHLAYVSQGRLFVSEIAKVDVASFLEALKQAERAEAMARTKQVALGVMMYLADNDDLYPLAGGISETVGPYVKNARVFDGFVYTFSGQSSTSIQDPATTMMGYTPVPGGRCVAYADGHVKFVPDP